MCVPGVTGVAAVSRDVPFAKPVPAAPVGVRLAEPGELTLITCPPPSDAKLLSAVSSPPVVVQFDSPSSAMKPSLNSAPGASSVRKRNANDTQLAGASTVTSSRSWVRSETRGREPSLDSVLPLSSSPGTPAGSKRTASPDERIAKVAPWRGKSEYGLSATAAGLPRGAICGNVATTLASAGIAPPSVAASRVGLTAALAAAGSPRQAAAQARPASAVRLSSSSSASSA